MGRPLLFVIFAGFLLGTIGGAALLLLNTDMQTSRVTTTGKALIGGPFSLVGKGGKEVTDQDFRGRHMLVFFGFTQCPDICPTTMAFLDQFVSQLPDDEARDTAAQQVQHQAWLSRRHGPAAHCLAV